MRFDLIDMQLFLHVAEAGSITGGAARGWCSSSCSACAPSWATMPKV